MPRKAPDIYDYWQYYRARGPRKTKGGLRANSKRGKFVKNWWGERWIGFMTQAADSGRLSRGRSYARNGQVVEIMIEPGLISALVQGSDLSPYQLGIQLQALSDEQWDVVFDELAGQAIYAAQLLSGEMPREMETIFASAHVPLFPDYTADVLVQCDCYDWSRPCKHIIAVYYLLGERFDRDPFMLFELRGRSKEQVLAALNERRVAEVEPAYTTDEIKDVTAPPLEAELDRYWAMGQDLETISHFDITSPRIEKALLKRLGLPNLAGWRAPSFEDQVSRVHAAVTAHAIRLCYTDYMNPEKE